MLSFLGEFWQFLRVRKKFWLLPVFIMMAVFGGLLVLAIRLAPRGIAGLTRQLAGRVTNA